MKLPVSWIREFVDVPANPAEVASRLASCGFAVDGIEGEVVDFDVTANRPDCLSVYGLSREAAVAFGRPLKALDTGTAPGTPASVKVSLGDPGCGRYALAVVDVRVGPSPDWMAARLRDAGVRPINNIVDVTNYVMLEMGHPMHAFDLAKLAGPEIHVRRARPGEGLTTLDGESRALDETMLVIADRDRAIAVAGVMGGAASEVSPGTSRIALESAWFWPASIRATSRKLGLKTEASIRFERGADITAPARAAQRALTLLRQIGASGGAAGMSDVYPRVAVARHVALRRARIARLLGQSIDDREIVRILDELGFKLRPSADGWDAEVPAFRVDVAREADLIEEVGRHWGFDRIPATLPALKQAPKVKAFGMTEDSRLRGLARGAGLQEAMTFTFMERAAAEPFVWPGEQAVLIANPLSEKFAVLRPSLLPGLLDALVYNRRRESEQVRLFELGSLFRPSGESTGIGWILTGERLEHWSGNGDAVNFFDAKGIGELLVQAYGFDPDDLVTEAADDLPWFVRGRSARWFLKGTHPAAPVGHVGQLRPELVSARGLDSGVVVGGELDMRLLSAPREEAGPPAPNVQPIPRYPSIVRDLSIIVPERLPAAKVRGTIRSNAPSTLVSVGEFDRYQGKGMPEGHISLSVRLTFRNADRTLTDSEVQQAVDAIVAALEREHGATLRGK